MKKILSIFIITLALSSCFGPKEDLNKAKQELGVLDTQIDSESELKTDSQIKSVKDGGVEEIDNTSEEKKPSTKDKTKPNFTIEELTSNQFIELDDLSAKVKELTDSIEITGKTLGDVDRIVVKFLNRDSDYPIDEYTLAQFKPGNKTFTYRAKSQFKVLDFGLNEYTFEAYSNGEVSKLQLNIFMPKPNYEKEEASVSDSSISYEKKLIGDEKDSVYLSLPKSSDFGDPLSTGDTITYSNINGLEIKREELSTEIINCDNVTDYLKTKINTWYYWNTCRDIIKDDGISYYVLRLDGDSYSYEKHYVDYKHGLYGVYIIKTGIEANKEDIANDIADKNKELKEQNDDFAQIKLVDKLFKEIVR